VNAAVMALNCRPMPALPGPIASKVPEMARFLSKILAHIDKWRVFLKNTIAFF
jgi:hypothetical protein